MNDMTPLLQRAIEAHGGLARWRQIRTIGVSASITGALWVVKGRAGYLDDVVMSIDTREQRVITDFPGRSRRLALAPGRISLEEPIGHLVQERAGPESSFVGQREKTPWDALHVGYFQGEALWTYFNTPFLFAEPDFFTQEIASIKIEGETWRRLKVTFPDRIKSHTREQIFCFGSDGLLRRHDYTVDILGGATGLNYAFDYRTVGGIQFFTKRRVYAYQGDYQLVPEPLLVGIDVSRIELE